MDTSLAESELVLGLGQSLENLLLFVGAAATESLLELLLGWGSDEDVAGREARGLDLLDTLHLDIEDDNLALGGLLLDGGLAGAVEVAAELRTIMGRKRLASGPSSCVPDWAHCSRWLLVFWLCLVVPLDETALGPQLLESLLGDIVVVDAILLAGSGAAGGVGDGKGEGIGVSLEHELEEGALADARGAGDDDGATVGRENWQRSQVSIRGSSRHGVTRVR